MLYSCTSCPSSAREDLLDAMLQSPATMELPHTGPSVREEVLFGEHLPAGLSDCMQVCCHVNAGKLANYNYIATAHSDLDHAMAQELLYTA